jgi:hypothetical protein
VYVAFAPGSSGARSGSITFPVTYNDLTKANFTATLAGNGVAASTTVAVSPTAINFGNQVVGQGVNQQYTVTVTNTGNTPVTFGTSTTSNTQFPIESDGCSNGTIQPGGSCSYRMGYAPTSTGTVSATLTIPDSTPKHPHLVTLGGAGIAAASQIVLSQTSVSFGNELVGVQGPTQTVLVTNQGGTTVTISSITVTGTNAADFSESSNCSTTLGANSSCQITLYFTPSLIGPETATVTETDSAAGSPRTISLTGTGLVATTVAATLYPTPLTFASTALDSSAQGSFSFTAPPASEYSNPISSPGVEVGGQLWYFEASSGSTCTGSCASSDYSTRYQYGVQSILIGDTLAHTVQNVVAALNNSAQTACGYTDPTSEPGQNTCYYTTTPQTSVTAAAASPAVNLTATVGGASGNCTSSTCYTGYGWSSYTTILGTGDLENISPAAGGLSGGIGAPQSFSVTNTSMGSNTLSITEVQSNSAAFPILHDACTGQVLTPGQNCLVSITFAPTAVGTNSSTISITDNAGTQSESVTGTGTKATTTTTLVSSLNPSTWGQSVTFTATVSGFSPTGTVGFTANGTPISGCSAVTLSSSFAAACSTSTVPAGTNAIVATYSGDANNNPSGNSLAGNQVINKATLTVTANNASMIYGGTVPTFTASYTGFVNGDTSSVLSGSPSLTTTATSASPAGTYTITAAVGTLAAANYTFKFVNGTLTINNPLPTATSLSPSSATAGGAAFTLTVTGTNFVPGSKVNWNGTGLTTTYGSGTKLTASVPASDIATAGTALVTVVNTSPGGGTSSGLTFTINQPALVSLSASGLSFGTQPLSTTSASQTETVTNTGTGNLTISTVTIGGTNASDFARAPTPAREPR